MALEETNRPKHSSIRARFASVRAILAAAAFILATMILQVPSVWATALVGFLFIALVALMYPRGGRHLPKAETAQTRKNVWPGGDMKAICEALGFPAYIIDKGGVLRYANDHARLAFGAARIGDPISFKFRNPEIVRLIGDAIAAGEARSMEYHDQIPPGRWFWLAVTPVPKAGQDAMFEFYLLTFVDLTETRRVEQMRSDFIANASHELRTPLASLRGFIETIKGPAASDPKASRQFLDLMLEQAERMARLVDDLLSLSRIEMKAHVRPSGTVELHDVIYHVRDALKPMAAKFDMALDVRIPPGELKVRGDRDEIIQVFENLVENACKYGRSGKGIEVSARVEERADGSSRVIVSVRDHGPGIAAEHLPRLTERFYRVDAESSREKQGTGLGLAIVKHILARHGTRLNIHSKPGEGATFSVAFALAESSGAVDGSNKIKEIQ